MEINKLSIDEILILAERQIRHEEAVKRFGERNPDAYKINQRAFYARKRTAKLAELQTEENKKAVDENREAIIITKIPPKGHGGRPKGSKNKPKLDV